MFNLVLGCCHFSEIVLDPSAVEYNFTGGGNVSVSVRVWNMSSTILDMMPSLLFANNDSSYVDSPKNDEMNIMHINTDGDLSQVSKRTEASLPH